MGWVGCCVTRVHLVMNKFYEHQRSQVHQIRGLKGFLSGFLQYMREAKGLVSQEDLLGSRLDIELCHKPPDADILPLSGTRGVMLASRRSFIFLMISILTPE